MARPDVVVVGAGIVGLAVAHEISAQGLRVLVLERGQVGCEASGVAGGFVSLQAQHTSTVIGLVREGLRHYLSLGDRLGADIGLRTCGSLMLAAGETEAEELATHQAALTAAGVTHQPLDAPALREQLPLVADGVTAGSYCGSDVQIDPPRLLAAYHDALERQGAEVRENRMVVGLQTAGDRTTGVRTRFGDIDADHVVLAAGAWTPVLLPPNLAGFVRARRGQLLVARPRRRLVQHLLLGVDYLRARFGEDAIGFTLEQTVDGIIRLGGTREWVGYDRRPTALLAEAEANASRYLQLPEGMQWSYATAGLRPTTPDGLPLVGSPSPGLWLAAGHEGLGFALAPVTAARLTAAIIGRPADLRAFNPGRFMTPENGRLPTSGE